MLRSVSVLLLSLALPPGAQAAGDAAAGKKTYDTLCFTCHGMTGKGNGPAGAALNPPPRDFSKGEFKFGANKDGKAGDDADLKLVIKNGAGAYGGNPSMAPWGHLSDKDIDDVLAYVRTLKNYLPEKPNFFSSSKDAQQAHEAIRPTDPDLTPDDIRQFLTDDQYKLYDLIWRRFVACQMAAAQWDTTRVEIEAKTSIGPCQ